MDYKWVKETLRDIVTTRVARVNLLTQESADKAAEAQRLAGNSGNSSTSGKRANTNAASTRSVTPAKVPRGGPG